MSILSPKCRLVSFRLTEEEYEELRSICQINKARTLSDFVRDSMCWMMKRRDMGAHESPQQAHWDTAATQIRAPLSISEYLSKGEVAKEIQSLTNMLLNLHRRTEVLGQQVDRLYVLMASAESEADESEGLCEIAEIQRAEAPELGMLRHAE